MPSHLQVAPRRVPRQARGERRVAAFLHAASAVIAEVGYEQATMSAIAERADSCIGSLYQFFPNKRALAEAVRAQHLEAIEQSWSGLREEAAGLTAGTLAGRLVDLQLDSVKKYPALLALMEVTPTSRTLARRKIIRARIADVLRAHRPDLPEPVIRRTAAVVQQVSRAMLALYARQGGEPRSWIVAEFRSVLHGYLVPKLTT
jgi:AcrR family transcriptional regulator